MVMRRCSACGQELPEIARYCTQCGTATAWSDTAAPEPSPVREEMYLPALYLMVVLIVLALLFPPWEAPPDQPPAFLGLHFILNPPEGAVISRILLTIELFTIAVGGFYFAWFFRSKR